MQKKIKKMFFYIKNGTFIHLVFQKISLKFITIISKNKNASIYLLQCRHYKKLYRQFSYLLNDNLTGEKKKSDFVWFCWLQGYDKAPDLIRACYDSVRVNLSGKNIIFLTEENIHKYVEFPKYITEKYEKGIIGKAHYSDLVRISLLCEYGGIWIDSTVLCTSPEFIDYITDLPIFVFKQIDLIRNDEQPIMASNWLISSESNNEICVLTRNLLYKYWEKYNYALDYFIFHLFFAMAAKKYKNIWENIPVFNNVNPHIMQLELNNSFFVTRWNQLLKISGIHKLNHHVNYADRGTIYGFIINNFRIGRDIDE